MKVGNQGLQVLIEENRLRIEDQDQNEVEHESQTKAECENLDEVEYENQITEKGNEADWKDHLNSSNDGHYEEEVNHIIVFCAISSHYIDHGT